MTENNIEKGSNLIIGIIFVAVFLTIMLLALVLIISSVNTASSNVVNGGITASGTVINETGAYINQTNNTLGILTTQPLATCSVTSAYNLSNNMLINAGNYTVVGCYWTNATSVIWNNVSVSYTWSVYSTGKSLLNSTTNTIQNGVLGLVTNFFALMPTVGTIMAVIILIAGIVLLVVYVRKMKDKGSDEGGFHG